MMSEEDSLSESFALTQLYIEKAQAAGLIPTPNIPELPVEIWEQILYPCSFRTVLSTRLWSRFFDQTVRQSTILQCKIECDIAGVVAPPPSKSASQLERLRESDRAWQAPKLRFLKNAPIHRLQVPLEQYSDSHALEYFVRACSSDTIPWDWYNVILVTRYSSMRGPEISWKIDYPDGFDIFAFDGRQDLLVLLSRVVRTDADITTRAVSLCTGLPHARAPRPSKMHLPSDYFSSFSNLEPKVAGDCLAVQITALRVRNSIILINWVTGCLLGIVSPQPATTIGLGEYFQLLSPNCLLCVGVELPNPSITRPAQKPRSACLRIYPIPEKRYSSIETLPPAATYLLPEFAANTRVVWMGSRSTLFKSSYATWPGGKHDDCALEALWSAGIVVIDIRARDTISGVMTAWRFVTPVSTFLHDENLSSPMPTAHPKSSSFKVSWEKWGAQAARVFRLPFEEANNHFPAVVGGYQMIMDGSAFDFNPLRVRRHAALQRSRGAAVIPDEYIVHTGASTIKGRSSKTFAWDVVSTLAYSEVRTSWPLEPGFEFMSEDELGELERGVDGSVYVYSVLSHGGNKA